MKNLVPGVNPVLLTPLDENGRLDAPALRSMVKNLAGRGVHGVVVLGSMGELPYLSEDERGAAVEAAVEGAGGAVRVIAGATAFGTEDAVRSACEAAGRGADALMVPLPVYFQLRFEEIFDFYNRIAGETGKPIIYYHIPSTTHLDLDEKQIARLFEIENIRGIKESIMDLTEIRRHFRVLPGDAVVYSGSSMIMRPVMEMGGRGTICPIPCIIPETVVALYEACAAEKTAAAVREEKKLFELSPLFTDLPVPPKALRQLIRAAAFSGIPMKPTPPPHALLKEALRLLGQPISARVKAPLPQLAEEDAARVKKTLEKAGLL